MNQLWWYAARASGVAWRSSGLGDMAFKQMASSAGSIDRRRRRGAGKMPRRTRSRTSATLPDGKGPCPTRMP